jgi:hypothetical protein
MQAKMEVNKPGDKFEQEADQTASKVARMPTPSGKVQRQPEEKVQKKEEEKIMKAAAPEEKVQKAPAPEEKLQKKEEEAREDKVQRKGSDGAPAVSSDTQSAIRDKSGGQPLSDDVRGHMEPRFNADFGNVRVHSDPESASLNHRLGARAFTYQNQIFFSRDQYQPGTSDGRQLLAHELTHTLQQGHAVQRARETPHVVQSDRSSPAIQQATAPAPAGAPAETSSEAVDLSTNVFNPSQKVKDEIEAHGSKGLDVRVMVKGLTAEGRVKIRADRAKNYDSIGKGSMPLLNAWTQQLGGMHVNFNISNSEIKNGYAAFKPGAGDANDWLEALRKNAGALGGLGLQVNNLPTPVNKFDNGKLALGVTNLKVQVGGYLDALFNLSIENMSKPKIDATADVDIKGIVKGQLKLDNNTGTLTGQLSLAIDYKSFSGAAIVKYNADGCIDVDGKGGYNADRLSGEIHFVATDIDAANSFAKDAIAAAGGKENVQSAGPPAPVPAPKPGKKKRALAATGQLGFNLTQWFAGTVNVVVDGKGAVTVIGKIAPPAEIKLFGQKDWDKEIVSFEAKAYYGLPVVGNLNLFANISLHALASLGPAKIYNIEILGTYSTDPDVQKSIQISGSINISAYGGLRLRAEGGAGVEILSHDLKFGVGLQADAGVKAYADARPTVGYRDPGEFYISGTLELVAQPMLGLGGDFFIALETPWWSPLSDDRWTWPLFSKEWPMGDPIGISASVKDYVLGSGAVPEIELKKPEFDPSKFMTNMVDRTLPDKSGGPGAGQGAFKEDGSVPKPVVPPKKPEPKPVGAKPGKKGSQPKAGKSANPDAAAAKDQAATKILQSAAKPMAALKSKGALNRAGLDHELAAIKAQVGGIDFGVQLKGEKWVVTPKAGGRPGKGVEVGAKDLTQKDKDGTAETRTEEQKDKDKLTAIAEAEKLISPVDFDEQVVRQKLGPIKSHYRLQTLDLNVDSKSDKKERIHFSASASARRDGREIEVELDKETKITHRTGSLGGDTVGMEMTADWLGPNPKGGSPPKSGVQDNLMNLLPTDPTNRSAFKFIRGHLLNEHLGGEGDADNMFPITGNANSRHLHSTESKIKNWVKERKRWVFYQVRVDSVSSKLDGPAKSEKNYVNCVFVCKAIQKDAAGETKNELATQITSQYEVKHDAKIDIAPT